MEKNQRRMHSTRNTTSNRELDDNPQLRLVALWRCLQALPVLATGVPYIQSRCRGMAHRSENDPIYIEALAILTCRLNLDSN